jgi:hypothetical protein
VKVRALYPLAAAAGLWMPSIGSAQQPAKLPVATANPNQVLADSVASQLRASGVAANSDVSIVAQEGVVTLTGFAKDAAQKARIAVAVKGVNGVIVVRDAVNTPARGIVQVQDAALPLAPVGPAPVGLPGGPLVEPCPLGASGQVGPEMGAPNLPPYSWPTYAPYNNVSRVAYPTAHPYNAFPFIGPYYPFPKVPLGWRKVTLEWEDGHWYLGRNTAPQDYWKVRFW